MGINLELGKSNWIRFGEKYKALGKMWLKIKIKNDIIEGDLKEKESFEEGMAEVVDGVS